MMVAAGSANEDTAIGGWQDGDEHFGKGNTCPYQLPHTATCRIGGCMEPEARNYLPRATQPDGSCVHEVRGCTDPSALDFASLASSLTSCTYAVPGCMDSRAANFLPAATIAVAEPAEAGGCALMGCTDPAEAAHYETWALHADGSCALGGCRNPAALNYMAGATHDDGSCGVLGCTDPYAANHDAGATLDDGSCVTLIRGCTAPEADNYNAAAEAPRGSAPYEAFAGTPPFAPDGCLYVGCMQPSATNYDSRAAYESGWCVDAPPGAPPPPRATSDGTIDRHTLLSHREGGFNFTLSAQERFGYSVAGIGDVDGDGTPDLAVGAPGYGGFSRGAVYVVFVDPLTGGAKGGRRLHDGLPLSAYDHFGAGVAGVGDLDGDGVPDLAVGAWGDDGDGSRGRANAGAVYILFLQRDGSAKAAAAGAATPAYRKLGSPAGAEGGEFGGALALLSSDGAGSVELAVGSPGGGAAGGGEVHILTLRPGGVLARTRQLAPAGLGMPGDRFGSSLSALDGMGAGGAAALAVGAPGSSSGDDGALLDLGSDVDGAVHVIDVGGGGGGSLLATLVSPAPMRGALFGRGVAGGPDYDGNGVADLVVGAPASAGGGALYVLFLGRNASDGHALHSAAHRRVNAADLGLRSDAGLGRSVARLGAVDSDLVEDLAVGIHYDVPLGGLGNLDNAGGALVLFLTAHSYPHPPPMAPPSAPQPPAPPLDSWEAQLLQGHNSRRGDHCAPALVWDASLAESAMAHAMRCPAADEPSAAAAQRRVGESLAVGSFHTTGAGVAAAWYSEVDYYTQYGDEPDTWLPAGRADRWSRFAQMVWVGSSRLGCGYSTNCSGAVPHWVCHYAAPGLGGGEFVANVKPNNGDKGCVLSPSPPSPPPPIASPPPNFPPFGKKGGLTDTASSIANPDEQGSNTKMSSVAVAAIVLCGLLFLALCYYMLVMRKSPAEIVMINWRLARTAWTYLRLLPEVLHGAFWQPSLLLGLAPETRLEINWSGLRAKARSAPPYEENFDAILPLEPGGVLPPAWPSGDEGGGGDDGAGGGRRPVTYATNYSAETTWQ